MKGTLFAVGAATVLSNVWKGRLSLLDAVSTKRDFFISFNNADRAWATWIAWMLEADWDLRGNFVEHMQRAHRQATASMRAIISRLSGESGARIDEPRSGIETVGELLLK
jgi:hypothetical protein